MQTVPDSKNALTLVIDFETANHSPASACAIGMVVLDKYTILHTARFLIRPPTSWFAFTAIHGLSWKDVEHAKNFQELWESDLQPWFRKAKKMVAHNIGFDQHVLQATERAAGERKQ